MLLLGVSFNRLKLHGALFILWFMLVMSLLSFKVIREQEMADLIYGVFRLMNCLRHQLAVWLHYSLSAIPMRIRSRCANLFTLH